MCLRFKCLIIKCSIKYNSLLHCKLPPIDIWNNMNIYIGIYIFLESEANSKQIIRVTPLTVLAQYISIILIYIGFLLLCYICKLLFSLLFTPYCFANTNLAGAGGFNFKNINWASCDFVIEENVIAVILIIV